MAKRNWLELPHTKLILFFVFTVFFILLHWSHIFYVPATNYDEVRAGTVTYGIAFQKGYWPFNGSNSYTVVFSDYWAAPFFQLFGSGLLSLRLSALFFVYFGILLISMALSKAGHRIASLVFPFITTFWPALFVNHRYSMEANTFLFFCFGLFLLGCAYLSKSKSQTSSDFSLHLGTPLVIVGAVLGILSHPLFIAPVLAALIVRLLQSIPLRIYEKKSITGLLFFFFIYFLRLLILIPEKEKGAALLLLDSFLILVVLNHSHFLKWVGFLKSSPLFRIFFGIIFFSLASVAITFLLTFSSTPWTLLTATGEIQHPSLLVLDASIWVFLIGYYLVGCRAKDRKVIWNIPLPWAQWIILSVLICAVILIQPSARCYEIGLVSLSIVLSLVLSKLPPRFLVGLVLLWGVSGTLHWKFNYIDPVLAGKTRFRELRFLFVKGVTETYPSPQTILKTLAEQECNMKGIDPSYYSHWKKAVEFVASGEWLPFENPQCRFFDGI